MLALRFKAFSSYHILGCYVDMLLLSSSAAKLNIFFVLLNKLSISTVSTMAVVMALRIITILRARMMCVKGKNSGVLPCLLLV
jgi:hypothetical protein